MALGASVTLLSPRGKRTIPLDEFYLGVRKTVMADDEILLEISFPAMKETQRGTFIKLGLRRAQAISIVNLAIVLDLNRSGVDAASITLGAVAPTIIHAAEAESYLTGKELSEEVIAKTAELAMAAATPIDDIRATAAYRREMIRVHMRRGLRTLRDGTAQADFPREPILLWGKKKQKTPPAPAPREKNDPIVTTINGEKYLIEGAEEKTLLAVLRDEIGLMGTKEGCGEGECGACTVYLDGKAVMSCLVPAPRAHGAEITTVEGIADARKKQLHPVQEAFIHEGAVQCGYCTPGFIMSAAKLLEEEPKPSRNQIEEAIAGNLCRCTGYYKIVTAIEKASETKEVHDG
jgi:carbon-monoxide dehydrogenase medium subunit